MTIDIRANVFCNLGPIIEGSLSDSYVQGNGLVYCRGSVTLDGIYQPTLGQVVDFAYQKNGWLSRFPRRLRVLSSFADPFTRQTQIELGCKLTYLKDYKKRETSVIVDQNMPPISIAASSDATNPIRESDRGRIPQSIGINTIIDFCLNALGITSSAQLPFSSRFNGSKFEAETTYVQMIDELLKSAGYVGYLDESEQLVLRNLTHDSGAGPVIGRDQVIAMEPIGIGEVPAEIINATGPDSKYFQGYVSGNQLLGTGSPQNPPGEPPEDPPLPPNRNLWTFDESIGSPQVLSIPYSYKNQKSTYKLEYVPYTWTVTEYDSLNRVSSRKTTERTYPPLANGTYWKAALETASTRGGTFPIFIETVTTYKYDRNGDVLKEVQSRYEPEICIVGKSAMPYNYQASDGTQAITVTYHPDISRNLLSERTTIEYDHRTTLVASELGFTQARGSVMHSKTKRSVEKLQLLTQEGQQRIAAASQDAVSQGDIINLATDMISVFVLDSVEVQTSSQASTEDLNIPKAETRPDVDKLLANSHQSKRNVNAKARNNTGQELDKRENSYDPSWTFDDYYVYDQAQNKYKPVGEPITAQVLRFARIQNRLRLANRAGLSLQLEPELVPVRPFDPLYINLDGIVGQYRVNGTSWAFSADGIAAQVDAMFWGGVGTV